MINENPTMQDVLRQFYPKYLESYTPAATQATAVHHILNCKKGAFNEWSPAGAYMEVAMVAAVATGKRHN